MQHYPLIRTIYLYIFTLTGLTLLVIGAVRFLDMGLKAFVFTKADEEQRIYSYQPPMPVYMEKAEMAAEGEELSETEKIQLKQALADYEEWKKRTENIDPITSRRHRDASLNLAMIIIGFPLYFYHWRIIRKETPAKSQ